MEPLPEHVGVDNATIGENTTPYSPLATIVFLFIGIVLIIIIIVGNGLVIVCICVESQLRKHRQNILIASLACADLFVGLLVMPLTLLYELNGVWILGGCGGGGGRCAHTRIYRQCAV
jgi:hypothetical protein